MQRDGGVQHLESGAHFIKTKRGAVEPRVIDDLCEMVRVVIRERDHRDDLAGGDVEHHPGPADGFEDLHLPGNFTGDNSLHAGVKGKLDVLAGGKSGIKRFFQSCQTVIVLVDLAEDMRGKLAAGVAAELAVAKVYPGDAKAEDLGMARRCQLVVKLDVAGLFRQKAVQGGFVMTRQKRGEGACRRPRVHDFRRVGMQHGDRQVGRQKSSVAIEDLAALGARHIDPGGAGIRLLR